MLTSNSALTREMNMRRADSRLVANLVEGDPLPKVLPAEKRTMAALPGWVFCALLVALMTVGNVVHAQTCGNGVLEAGEQCDLGSANCLPGVCCETSCSSTCQLIGLCTGNQACCTSDADCPAGQGCCGDGVVTGDEQCDDGNKVDGDCCSRRCEQESPLCVPLPSSCGQLGKLNVVANPSIRRTYLVDSRPKDGIIDHWTLRDRFTLPDYLNIDPGAERVELILNQNDGTNQSLELYHATLDPAACPGGQCFTPHNQERSWTFRLTPSDPDIAGAPGLRQGRYRRPLLLPSLFRQMLQVERGTILAPQLISGVRRVRASQVIGDVCVTRALDCEPRRLWFACREAHCGNGVVERREECGEPGLPACPGSEVCDTCRCFSSLP
jgi:cysteine-rich repeat protein